MQKKCGHVNNINNRINKNKTYLQQRQDWFFVQIGFYYVLRRGKDADRQDIEQQCRDHKR